MLSWSHGQKSILLQFDGYPGLPNQDSRVTNVMDLEEERKTETEVLKSIFDGDDRFKIIDSNKFQYKYGEDGHFKSFLMEIVWPDKYPETLPDVNLDLFYNAHLLSSVKEYITSKVLAEAENCIGMAATFTLIEFVKENYEDLVKEQVEFQSSGTETAVETGAGKNVDTYSENAAALKKSKMTKAQKRRMWEHTTASTFVEKERGWNWVDVVKHLSQTKDSI